MKPQDIRKLISSDIAAARKALAGLDPAEAATLEVEIAKAEEDLQKKKEDGKDNGSEWSDIFAALLGVLNDPSTKHYNNNGPVGANDRSAKVFILTREQAEIYEKNLDALCKKLEAAGIPIKKNNEGDRNSTCIGIPKNYPKDFGGRIKELLEAGPEEVDKILECLETEKAKGLVEWKVIGSASMVQRGDDFRDLINYSNQEKAAFQTELKGQTEAKPEIAAIEEEKFDATSAPEKTWLARMQTRDSGFKPEGRTP